MLTENEDSQNTKNLILDIVKEKKPESTRQLIYLAKKEINIPEKQLFKIIQELEEEKILQFDEIIFPESIAEYIFSFRATWFWIIVLLSILAAVFASAIPDNLVPQVYARSFLGFMLTLYFPGYTLIKVIYPIRVPLRMRSTALDSIERIALSIGLSLTVTPFTGLILYYTPLGLNPLAINLSLLTITILFSTLAVWREYHARRALFLRRLIIVSKYELSDNAIKFFDVAGIFKNRLVLVKEIPINEITSIESRRNELSITSNGATNIFFMRYDDSQSVTELLEKIRAMCY